MKLDTVVDKPAGVAQSAVQHVELAELTELSEGQATSGRALGERYDLVDNVRVMLNVELGKADLSIKTLFDLRDGSVVALDRGLNDPVELVLDGKVVARGVLVAAGDRFGVQVTEIAA